MRQALVALTLLSALLAGCSGDPSSTEQEPAAFEEVEVTDTTGAIRGVVVNEAIVPIAAVLVTLNTGVEATTDEQGAFVFNGLEPGTYFLSAAKAGYGSAQTSADVKAGDKSPPVTKITLVAQASEAPFTSVQVWEGFVQCAFMVAGSAGAQACGELDGRFIHYFSMDAGIPDYAQAEMVWQSTQALGNDLDLEFYDGGTWYHKFTGGVSPLMLNATGEEIEDWWTANATELPMRVFPGSSAPASVTTNQQFTVYMTMFYNFVPRQGWSFLVDGPCDEPSMCT